MTDAKAPEPSIEEILASIRKIISDDDPEAAEEPPAQAAPPAAAEEDEDTVLDLTEVVEEGPVEHHIQPVQMPEPEPVHSLEPMPAAEPDYHPQPAMAGLASAQTVAAASGAIAKLAHYEPPAEHGGGKSVEDIVREMLNPMLREWIDHNLAGIVERLVDRELKKISRKAEDS